MPTILRSFASLLIVSLVSLINGCGTYTFLEAGSRQPPLPLDQYSVLVIPAPTVLYKQDYQEKINEFALMAWFSNVVYRKDLNEEIRTKNACDYLTGSPELFGMPADGHWGRLALQTKRRYTGEVVTSCYDQNGLYYETYFHKPNAADPNTYAVIAIRGTENYSRAAQLKDWPANLEAVAGIDPAEYRDAREHIKPLIDQLTEDYPKVQIYVTGHSLGGGIAQQMAYVSKEIIAAYVFDSSPVTNWSKMMMMDPTPINKANPVIHRIYHRHEVLASIRNAATRLTATRLYRDDFEFFYKDASAVGSHGMYVLACNFAYRIEGRASFDFSRDAAFPMLEKPALCPSGSIMVIPRTRTDL